MGEQIKLARLRRDLSVELVAERAGISRSSLWKVESGNPAVAIVIYAAVLHVFNDVNKDFLLVAMDDEMGRKMKDIFAHNTYVKIFKESVEVRLNL